MAKQARSRSTAGDPYRLVLEESKARPVRVAKIPVLTYKYDWTAEGPIFTRPGTMTVFVAKKGSRALKQVRAAADGGSRQLRALQRTLQRQAGRGRNLSGAAAARAIVRSNVFSEVRYGGTALHKGIFMPPGLEVFPLVLPYNGGRLARGGFTLAEFHREGSREALEAVVIKSSPPLTRVERAALRLVPADQNAQNIGVSMDCDTTYWAAAGVAAGVVVAAAVLVASVAVIQCGKPEFDDYLHVSQREIDRLGPAASARQLLDLRRKELEGIMR